MISRKDLQNCNFVWQRYERLIFKSDSSKVNFRFFRKGKMTKDKKVNFVQVGVKNEKEMLMKNNREETSDIFFFIKYIPAT